MSLFFPWLWPIWTLATGTELLLKSNWVDRILLLSVFYSGTIHDNPTFWYSLFFFFFSQVRKHTQRHETTWRKKFIPQIGSTAKLQQVSLLYLPISQSAWARVFFFPPTHPPEKIKKAERDLCVQHGDRGVTCSRRASPASRWGLRPLVYSGKAFLPPPLLFFCAARCVIHRTPSIMGISPNIEILQSFWGICAYPWMLLRKFSMSREGCRLKKGEG